MGGRVPVDGVAYLTQLGAELGVSAVRDEFQKIGAEHVLRAAQKYQEVWLQLRTAALALVATGVVDRDDADATLHELLEPGARAMSEAMTRTAGLPEMPVDYSAVSFLDEAPYSGRQGDPPV